MPPTRTRERCPKACDRCRSLKIKCSGTRPCSWCEKKGERCHFAVEERRVTISESYLRELQSRTSEITPVSHGHNNSASVDSVQAGLPQPSSPSATGIAAPIGPATPQSRRDVPSPGQAAHHQTSAIDMAQPSPTGHVTLGRSSDHVEPGFSLNPLADNDHTFATADGRYWYMGPSSSWSFCRRVLAFLGRRIPEAAPDPWHAPDKGAYHLQWTPLRADEMPEVNNLPPLDFAMHLVHSAKYYLGDVFNLVDEPDLRRQIAELYENPAAKAQASRAWFAHFLLLLAFGRAFPSIRRRQEPPGLSYALRALTLLPDMSSLYQDPVAAIQAFVLAALYFQSLDMRVAAYYHISHALRTCVIEGMHRHIPEEVVGKNYSERCSRVFWVVYVLEKHISSLFGSPSSISDTEITARSPSDISQSPEAMSTTLLIRLSRMTNRILMTVYGVGRQFDNSLVTNTQSIIRDLARFLQDLQGLFHTHFQESVSKASRMAQKLIIGYHHCVVLSTRPLFMCALQMHVENTDTMMAQTVPLSPVIASLLQSGVDSAQNVLKMLRILGEEDMLDAFLPFQLEWAYSSAFVLYLVRLISPSLLQDDSWTGNVEYVFDQMILDGSLVAPLRKQELSHLEQIMSSLSSASTASWGLTPGPSYIQLDPQAEPQFTEDVMGDPFWNTFVAHGMSGMAPEDLFDLANQLDDDGVPGDVPSLAQSHRPHRLL